MNMKHWICAALLGAVVTAAAAQTPAADKKPAADAKPGYRVEADARGVWAFVAPNGSRFLSMGVNNVSPTAYNPRPGSTYYDAANKQFGGDVDKWARATHDRLVAHGINTIGAWSSGKLPADQKMHRTIVLYVAGYEQDRCLAGLRPDFESVVKSNMRTTLEGYPDRSHLLGVFLDNEAPWYGRFGWQTSATFSLLERALELEPSDAARTAAAEFLKSRYKTIGEFNTAWGLQLADWSALSADELQTASGKAPAVDRGAFTALAAERFFQTAAKVVRQEMPGVLLLGVRYAGNAPDGVIVADGKVSDVISLNDYRADPRPDINHFGRFWLLGKRPIVITEFAWRAKENASGCPNTRGAGAVVATQKERAAAYEQYVTELARIPVIIGAHWFEFADQSPQGRFDGEDSNYGIVDLQDRPYTELLDAMKRTHATIADLRAGSPREMPSQIAAPQRARYTPGQYPDRPPEIDLLGEWIREPELWGAGDAHLTWKRDGAALELSYEAGEQYGAGINIFGPKSMKLTKGPAEATNLDGYTTIVVDYVAPRGVQLSLVLAEAAAGPPGQPDYASTAGDDGEAWVSESFFGKSAAAQARIPIADLGFNYNYGNQRGARTIDMAALRNLGIQIQGKPKTGVVRITGFKLVR